MNDTKKNKFTLALIMNAIVLPGSGHFLVDRKAKGTLISSLTVLFIFMPAIKYTMTVISALQMMSIKSPTLGNGLSSLGNAWQTEKNFIICCFIAISILWIYSILDIYFIKKKLQNTPDGGNNDGLQTGSDKN